MKILLELQETGYRGTLQADAYNNLDAPRSPAHAKAPFGSNLSARAESDVASLEHDGGIQLDNR